MKEIKQNKNSSVIRFLAFMTAFVVLLFSISIPSFAYTDTSTNGIDFSSQPIPSDGSRFTIGTALISPNRVISFSTNQSDVYIYAYASGSWIYTAVCSRTSSSFDFSYYVDNTQTNKTANLTASRNGNTYYYAKPYSSSAGFSDLSIPLFSSFDDGLSAVDDWISNPPDPLPDPQGPLNISIPCGNALFIDISDLSGITGSLSTQTSQSHSSPFSWNSTLSYTDSVPTSGSPVGNPINWVGSGGTDVFGRYRSWQCNLIVQPNKKYIAITNPFFNSEYLDPEHEDTNFPITVSLSNYRDYFFVPLNAQYVNGEGVQNSYTDEQTQAPTPGGNNTTTTGNSINDFLQNIASSISGFFQGAIGAVSTLVSAGSDFMRSVSGLYSWLPAPVYTVLTSAIILVITIGVIKVFI